MGKNKKKNGQLNKKSRIPSKEMERGTKDKKRRTGVLIMVIVAIGIAAVLGVSWRFLGADKAPSQKVVFTMGKEAVYLDEVNLCILQNVLNLGITTDVLSSTAEDGSSADTYYKGEIVRLIMDYKVEAAIAQKQGIQLTNEEEKSIRQDAVEYMGKIDGRILKQLGITQDRVIEIYKQRYLAHALEESVIKDIELEEDNYCTIYLLLFPKVETDETGDYVKEEDGQTPVMLSEEQVEEQKEKADAAYKELLDGADIEKIADQYGVAAVSGEESNLADSFGEPFSKYAKELKEGEYSPVLDTASCYAVLKMVKVNNEELAKQILEHYKSDLEKETVAKKKAEWYEEAGVGQEPDFVGNTWKSISLYDFVQYVEE